MSKVKHLKDKQNIDGIIEQCRQTNELMKEVKEKNSGSTKEAATTLQNRKKSLLHHWGYIHTSHISPPASRHVQGT